MFSDINECMEENDCDDMATCKDFPFNYTCTCNTKGFEGTGKECTGSGGTITQFSNLIGFQQARFKHQLVVFINVTKTVCLHEQHQKINRL